MKKYFLYFVLCTLSLCTFTACHKEKVNIKAESEAILDRASVRIENALTPQEAEDEQKLMIDSLYMLLDEHMGESYSDTLFMSLYFLFSQEQKQALFAKMPKEMLETEQMTEVHKTFLIEAATSAGNPYTDFTALTIDGEEVSLSDMVGESDFVLVDFWATWCRPCRQLIPVLRDIYYRYGGDKLEILSCSVDRNEQQWREVMFEERFPWQSVIESDKYPCSEKYAVTAIPCTILINKEGIIVARNPSEAELEEILLEE